jgi:hypothetical protein
MTSKKYAVVEFLSTRDEGVAEGYTYINNIKAKKYDAVIVPTKYGVSMAVVVRLTDDSNFGRSGYSCSITKELAEVVKSKEVAKLMRDKKRKDLEKLLEKKVKEMDTITRFAMYADQDPEFAKLLEEYKAV